jgi:flap endonuclease-1
MGIKQLNKVLKKVAPSAIKEKSIHEYKHSKIAIDSAILVYKYMHISKGVDNPHIHGFVQRVCFYLKRGILPVFVFDGAPPKAKSETLVKRSNQKSKVETQLQTLILKRGLSTSTTSELPVAPLTVEEQGIDDEIDKLRKQQASIPKRIHHRECKYLLALLGVPFIESKGEGETTCAALQKRGLVDYTFTEDTDALTFGAPRVLKSAKKMEMVVETDLNEVLDKMGLSMDSFIDFCILCGCDYCPTIPKIGPVTALKLINEHGSIETIIENLDKKYTVPDNFEYETARRLFNHDPIEDTVYNLNIKSIQTDKLNEFLTVEKEMSVMVFESIVKQYTKALSTYNRISKKSNNPKPTHKPIDSFFSVQNTPN